MIPFRITHFKENDRQEVKTLLSEIGDLYPGGSEWLERRLGEPRAIIRIAEMDCSIVGISIEIGKPLWWKLCTLFIHHDYRGIGIGTSLIQTSLDYWKQNSIDRVIVTVRLERSPMLLGLLKEFGFTKLEVQKDRYGPGKTEVILQRWLKSDTG